MGEIVGATLCAHVPRLMMSAEEKEKYMGKKGVSTLDQALIQMYETHLARLDMNDCGTFLIFDTHWYTATDFCLDARRRHQGSYTSNEVPRMIHGYRFSFGGDPELAELITQEVNKEEMLSGRVFAINDPDMEYSYPTLVTMHYLNPLQTRLVLPMSIAYTSSIEHELAYGQAIKRAVERSNRNVVLVATGGLSHKFLEFADIPGRASANPENIYSPKHRAFDELIIDLLLKGRHADVIRMSETFREQFSPEGRFAHYLRMAAALGGEQCVIPGIQYGTYEAAIGTGQVVMWFEIPPKKNAPFTPPDDMPETMENPSDKGIKMFGEDPMREMGFRNFQREKDPYLVPVGSYNILKEET